MMMAYDTIGCFIWDRNHSFAMIRKSRECVINVPSVALATADRIDDLPNPAPRPAAGKC